MGQLRLNRILMPLFLVILVQEIQYLSRYFQYTRGGNVVRNEVIDDFGRLEMTNRVMKYDFSSSAMDKQFRVTEVDCGKIMKGDQLEIAIGKHITSEQLPPPQSDLSMYMELKNNCTSFKNRRGYILHHLSEEELDFPIAVSLLLFKEFHQVEELLRTIYRPQNFYCLHVDLTSDPQLHAVVRAYVDCFDNVVMSNHVTDVVWGAFSLSEPEFLCMYELLKYKWKYFINLTGQEFPLKTNRQIVRIFKAFKGANDIWTSPMDSQGPRFEKRWNFRWGTPRDISIVKGSSHIVLSREFVEFITSDIRVTRLATFLEQSTFPEEALWTTLNNDASLRAPGGFNGSLEEAVAKPWNGRVKWWQSYRKGCAGKYKRSICIFGVGDIHRITKDTPIMANKFYWDYQPIALRCMKEWMFNRTRDEYLGLYEFDTTQYSAYANVLKQYRQS